MDIIITIPKTISWSDYEKEIEKVRSGEESMYYRVSFCPKTGPGDRCYVCHDGFVKGWMEVQSVNYLNGFECTTTGQYWKPGWYIERSGKFHCLESPIPMKGFRGIRYYEQLQNQ